MINRLMTSIATVLVIFIGHSALAQELNFFYSSGKRIPLVIQRDLVAFEGEPSAVRDPVSKRLIMGAQEYANSEDPRIDYFNRSRSLSFLRVYESSLKDVQKTLRSTESGVRVGVGATIPQGDLSRKDRPLVVLTDEFIVRFKPGVTLTRVNEINTEKDVVIVRPNRFVENQFVLRPNDRDPERALALTQEYHMLPEVDGLSLPNLLLPVQAREAPSDPLFKAQWHLNNSGQAGGKPGADIGVLTAWTITKGRPDVVIAIIDPTGIEHTHEDLIDNRFINNEEIPEDGLDNDNNGFIDDVYGWNFLNETGQVKPSAVGLRSQAHGTAVAGIAVAAINNKGVCGVAPECKFLPIVAGGSVEDSADAILYAMKMGASVINCSWGYPIGTPLTQPLEEAISVAAKGGRNGKGCVISFAMTNEKVNNFTTRDGGHLDISSHPDVIAVGRSTNNDQWGHSGYGKGMALLAPTGAGRGTSDVGFLPNSLAGTLEITTTDLTGSGGYSKGQPTSPGGLIEVSKCYSNINALEDGNDKENGNDKYTSCFYGTSAAAPIVSGVAALVISEYPEISAKDARRILVETAVKIDVMEANYQVDADGRQYSTTHGYGRVSAGAAVTQARQERMALGTVRPMNIQIPVTRFAPSVPAVTQKDGPRSDDRPALVRAVASPPAPISTSVIDGRTAERVELMSSGKQMAVYVIANVFALDLGGANSMKSEALSRLGEPFKRVEAPWIKGFEDQAIHLVEIPQTESVENAYSHLLKLRTDGAIRSVGWLVYLDRLGRQPCVVLDKIVLEFRTEPTAIAMSRLEKECEFDIVQNTTKFNPNKIQVRPARGTHNLTDLINRIQRIQVTDELGVNDSKTRLTWVFPIQKR